MCKSNMSRPGYFATDTVQLTEVSISTRAERHIAPVARPTLLRVFNSDNVVSVSIIIYIHCVRLVMIIGR